MAVRTVTVSLTEQERLELEEIIIDRNRDAALDFLERAIHQKIMRAEHGRMKSHLETGT